MLPNFLIIGAQKAGTTWLAAQLSQHPEIYVAPEEVHYFDKGSRYAKGIAWYESFFSESRQARHVGEKTPDYLYAGGRGLEDHLPEVHRHVHAALPHAKLIAILRDPVERAVSAVNHLMRTHRVPPSANADRVLKGDLRHIADGHGVLDYGRYARQLDAYLELYGDGQLLVLVYEEAIVAQPEVGVRAACRFLGAADFAFPRLHERHNEPQRTMTQLRTAYRVPLLRPLLRGAGARRLGAPLRARPTPPVLRRLYELYAEDNERLYALLGRRIPAWDAAADRAHTDPLSDS